MNPCAECGYILCLSFVMILKVFSQIIILEALDREKLISKLK